jgi:MYXO-CTERM domain-containing protein
MNTGIKTLIAGAAVMTMVSTASAARLAQNIDVYHNPSNFDIAGASFIGDSSAVVGVVAKDNGSSFTLDIGNALNRGSVSEIYLESSFADLISGSTTIGTRSINSAKAPVIFNEVAPANPIAASSIGWDGTALAFKTTTGFTTGLGKTADRLLLTFDYASGVTFADVAALIGTEGYRVASFAEIGINEKLQIGGVTSGIRNPDAGTVSSVPTPTAAAGGLALLGLAGLRRRKD